MIICKGDNFIIGQVGTVLNRRPQLTSIAQLEEINHDQDYLITQEIVITQTLFDSKEHKPPMNESTSQEIEILISNKSQESTQMESIKVSEKYLEEWDQYLALTEEDLPKIEIESRPRDRKLAKI